MPPASLDKLDLKKNPAKLETLPRPPRTSSNESSWKAHGTTAASRKYSGMRWSRRRAAGRARTPRPSSILAGTASRDMISRRTKRTVAYGTTVSGGMTEYKIGTNCCFSGNLGVDEAIWYGYSQLEEGPTGRNGRKFFSGTAAACS
jgi:hypothetical protein